MAFLESPSNLRPAKRIGSAAGERERKGEEKEEAVEVEGRKTLQHRTAAEGLYHGREER